MSSRSMAQRLKDGFFNPPTMIFALLTVPVLVIAWQVKPANHDEQIKELRQRYGYQYEQNTRTRNQKALEAMWQARDKNVSDYTPAPITNTTNKPAQ